MSDDRPKFMTQAKGGKIGKLTIKNATVIGDGDFMDMNGEIDEAVIEDTHHIVPPRLKKMAEAIKKPTASGKIVGAIFTAILTLIVGIILLNYEWHHEEASQLESNKDQKQQPKGNQ